MAKTRIGLGAGSDPERGVTPSEASTRERIKAVAAALYIARGHDGFSFGDIAEEIGVTRANIHHHFGNKRRLMLELVADFTADAVTRIERHWLRDEARFSERLAAQREDLRRFYERANRDGDGRRVWSPVARMRLDLAILGAPAQEGLGRINQAYARCLRAALQNAVRAGELDAAIPIDDVAHVLRVMLLSCPPITQDTGTFAEIDELFAAIDRMVAGAWASRS